MARINEVITPRAFELIRDRVIDILIDEIDNQFILSGDNDLKIKIGLEKTIPVDKTELSFINVALASGILDNKKSAAIDGNYIYNIDVYTSAKTTDSQQGDTRSALKLQKILGKCQYILDNPIYKNLGFQMPYLSRVYCNDINIAEVGKQDALSVMMGRLTLNVRVTENINTLTPNLIEGFETKIKIGETEKGYYIIG